MRDKYLKIRVSAEDHQEIQKKWKGYNMSHRVRSFLLEGPPLYYEGKKVQRGTTLDSQTLRNKSPEEILEDGTVIMLEKTTNTYFALLPGDPGYDDAKRDV